MKSEAKTPPIVVIGGANMDLSGQAAVAMRSGDSLPGTVRASAGGVGRNIAEALARLGRLTKLIAALGDDGFAEDIVRQTSVAGVDLRATLRVPEQTTSTYLSVLDSAGEMQLAINDMDLVNALTPKVLAERMRDLEDAKAWVVDANLSEDALAFIFSNTQSNIPVFAEPVSVTKAVKLLPWLSEITLLKPNRIEAAALTGRSEDSPVEDLSRALHDLGVKRVVISQGRDGVWGSDADGDVFAQPIFPVSIQSVTGAGDTLMAALVDTYLAGLPLSEALPWAQAAASLSLQSSRAIHPGLCEAAVRSEQEAHKP